MLVTTWARTLFLSGHNSISSETWKAFVLCNCSPCPHFPAPGALFLKSPVEKTKHLWVDWMIGLYVVLSFLIGFVLGWKPPICQAPWCHHTRSGAAASTPTISQPHHLHHLRHSQPQRSYLQSHTPLDVFLSQKKTFSVTHSLNLEVVYILH